MIKIRFYFKNKMLTDLIQSVRLDLGCQDDLESLVNTVLADIQLQISDQENEVHEDDHIIKILRRDLQDVKLDPTFWKDLSLIRRSGINYVKMPMSIMNAENSLANHLSKGKPLGFMVAIRASFMGLVVYLSCDAEDRDKFDLVPISLHTIDHFFL